ncbi:MAG TPA: type II toxin-antitoxin system VapC family toxin [Terriglobales bacterium]|nr:type II toxin-antitoxin system VapC family toxin [Terriglobales bacterium]
MTPLVIDASVAAKWVLPKENLAGEAADLLAVYGKGEIAFAVPDLFWAETANILWKAARLGRQTRAQTEAGLQELLSLALPTTSSADLVSVAFRLAIAYDRTIYDSLYLALAVKLSTRLITADEKLARSVAAHLPVEWLGAR